MLTSRLTSTADGWGYRYFNYDNLNRLTNISNAYGAEQGTVFDVENRAVYVTDANGVTVTNTYDDLGRLRTRGYPDGGVEKFGYSARGLVAYTNQLTFTNFYAYDEALRKTYETNANGEIIRYTNSAAGDLLSLTDGKNQTTRWQYNQFGSVTNKLNTSGPGWASILAYKYDADNRLTNRWSIEKGNTAYSYDAVGNLTFVNYPSSPDVTLQYDALNRLTNMVDAVGTTEYTYTAGGQLLTEDGPFASDTVTNIYVNRLRVGLGLQQPSGVWTNAFGYDAAKRLTNVTSQAGSFAYAYHASRITLPIKVSLPNTSYITNTYDKNARLLATWLKTSGNIIRDSATYTYNAGNQRTVAGLTNAASSRVNYTYDKIGQLKVADSSVNSEDRGYKYDAAGNLNYLTNNGAASSFTVDVKNQLTLDGDGNPDTYDSDGDLISGQAAYTYDAEHRLTALVSGGGDVYGPASIDSFRTDFLYDGLGRLRKRVEYHADWCPDDPEIICWIYTAETHYIYDSWRVIQERDANNVPLVSYTRGSDLSGTLEGAGGIGGLLARSHGYSSGNWSTHNCYHADGNGNITALVNSSQTLVASYRYDPFGKTVSKSGTLADANVYRFSSKESVRHDFFNVEIYYYGYRFYDPVLQRWLNRDPLAVQMPQDNRLWGNKLHIEVGQGANLYWPFANDPISRTDKDGQIVPILICIGVACILSGCSKAPPSPPKDPNDPNNCWKEPKNLPKPGGKAREAACQALQDKCEQCCATDFFDSKGSGGKFEQCLQNCATKGTECKK